MMKEDEKRLLRDWQPCLEQFLDPMDMMELLPTYFKIGSPEYYNVYSKRKNHQAAVRKLIEAVLHGDMYLQEFMGAIRGCGHDWLATLVSGEIAADEVEKAILEKENLLTIRKILTLITTQIKETIVAIDVANILRREQIILGGDFQQVEAQSKNDGNSAAVRVLLSILVRKPPGWWNDFHRAMCSLNYDYSLTDSFKSLIMVEKLPEYASSDIPGECNVAVHESGNYGKNKAILTQVMTLSRTEDISVNLSQNQLGKQKPVLKKYQENLACDAIDGKNVIICAPTGSEKTIVASHVIYTRFNHIIQSHDPKTAFIVHQEENTETQCNIIKSYLGDAWNIDYLKYDDNNNTLESAMNSLNVIVMTPEIVVNALENGSLSSLTKFKMIVFDECHHTTGKDNYNIIMSQYLNLKQKGSADLPQIIGLTANLGVAESEVPIAVERILTLCANLDATGGVVTVPHEQQNELCEFTSQRASRNFSLDESKDRVTNAISDAIDKLLGNDVSKTGLNQNNREKNLNLVQQGVVKIIVCTNTSQVLNNSDPDCEVVVPLSHNASETELDKELKAALINVTSLIQRMVANDPKKYYEEIERLQKRYKVICKNCDQQVCTSCDIELLETMHTFDDFAFKEKFIEKVVFHGGSEEKKGIFCPKCDLKWGIFQKYMQIRIPLLRADGFKFVLEIDPESTPLTGKQWSNIRIIFKKVTYDELSARQNAAKKTSSKD